MANNTKHSPIKINNLTIGYNNKSCIEKPLTANIYYGDRIAIIGRNGTGKSSLLSCLSQLNTNYEGRLAIPDDVISGYVPQIVNDYEDLSGGQRFNKKLNQALALQPNLLLLDEPTNHLDTHNRKSLLRFLEKLPGTIIVVSHDLEGLSLFDHIWHFYNNGVNVFNGNYSDYMAKHQQFQNSQQNSLKDLNKEKTAMHQKLMQEQQRAKTSKEKGKDDIKNRKYPTVTSATKAGRGITTGLDKTKQLDNRRQNIIGTLNQIYIPEELIPKFNLQANSARANSCLINIENGSISYEHNSPILSDINFRVSSKEKILLQGNNGSGKTTFIKAILGNNKILRTGLWEILDNNEIGYLDQHYKNLEDDSNAIALMQKVAPTMTLPEIRDHLNSYLLRKNEEVHLAVQYLSGGEKARLSLAIIAIQTPKLLILDEITNNLDLETKSHIQSILASYPSSYLLICHESTFCEAIEFDSKYVINDGRIIQS